VTAADFDLKALFAALDQQRQARGLTWTAVARDINSAIPSRNVSTSTITGLAAKPLAEADGVLQMLRWLDRAPEFFMRHLPRNFPLAAMPDRPASRVLRFDTRKLHAAIDERRKSRGMTWQQLADDSGVPASHFRTLANGGRTAFPYVTRLTRWLGLPAADFMHVTRY
jgi:hypothetical protein